MDRAVSDTLLSTDGVGMNFGGFVALKDVSVAFPRGQLTAVIGPNGAGKSTFFNVISGALTPTSGRIAFEGRDITGTPPHLFARIGIAKSFQITTVFPELTARENVRNAVQALSERFQMFRSRDSYPAMIDKADALLARVGLAARRTRLARELAHGEQRSLEIAMALAAEPKLMLMDEPTAGMSPEETREMMELIARLAQERTVVLVEHKMKLVMGLAQHLVVLHHGELLAQGTPDEIRNNDQVKRVYLGQGTAQTARAH